MNTRFSAGIDARTFTGAFAVVVASGFCGSLGACAENAASTNEPDAPTTVAAVDGGADAAPVEEDAEACTDCSYFPSACAPDVFCPNGPFDLNDEDASVSALTLINVIRGRSASDIWVAGALGAIAHFDGTSWSRSEIGSHETMRALWLRDEGEVALGELATVYTRGLTAADAGAPSAGGWTVGKPISSAPEYSPSSTTFASAWAPPGAEWLWCATVANTAGSSSGLWRLRLPASGPPELGAALSPTACSSRPCSQMLALHGASADALWAVGMTGAVVRITGAQSTKPSMTVFNGLTWNALEAVWESSETDAWAVGTEATIRHYTGDALRWDIVADVPTTVDLHGVWGSSAFDVWAVGDDAVVLHYDGKSWSRVKIAGLGARRPNLTTVWVAPSGQVWIGGQGIVLSLGGKS